MNNALPLRDVHLPQMEGFDFGAWLFMLVMMLTVIILMYFMANWLKQKNAYKTHALHELQQLYLEYLQQKPNDKQNVHQYIHNVALLIRRYVYSLDAQAPIHLPGEPFFSWLVQNGAPITLEDDIRLALINAPYVRELPDSLGVEKVKALHEFGQHFFKNYQPKVSQHANV